VRIVENKVQVAGQTAVMAINGLLTKVIFEQNPQNEFYVEESFPLDWMFPYLTPFGIIMKINRERVPEITDEMMQKDHQFWSQYSDRLVGNWITYDTPLKDVCAFAERVYLRRDFTGFKGDRKFIRDDVAQKSFSKLRSAIGGLYAWRLSQECPADLRPKTAAEQQRLLRETEFALRQAFAFCPYSPEAVYKLMNLLMGSGRVDEALLVTETSLRFDPSNPVFQNLANQLRTMRPGQSQIAPSSTASVQLAELQEKATDPRADVSSLLAVAQSYAEMGNRPKLEGVLARLKTMEPGLMEKYKTNTNDIQVAFQLISIYMVLHQTNEATQMLDEVVGRTNADASTFLSAAQAYAQLFAAPKLESTLHKLTIAVPESPEAWYDLASVQASTGKPQEALKSLKQALQLNNRRLAAQPGSKDLRPIAAAETHFAQLRSNPEFQQLTRTN